MHTRQARVVMITPLHDPAGALAPLADCVLQRQGPSSAWMRFHSALDDVRVLASEETAAVTCDAIRALGATVIRREDEGRAFMWAMTGTALSMDATHVFMPDTDRLLHWLLTYPEELVSLSDV